jgi:hypothetical protein
MTEIFKISLGNDNLKELLPDPMYFETQEAAAAVMNTFNAMVREDIKLEWICEMIYVLSKEDAFEEFMKIARTLPS